MTPTSKKVPDKEKPLSQLNSSVSKSNWLSKPKKSLAERFMSPKIVEKTVERRNVSRHSENVHKSKSSEIRALQQSTVSHRNRSSEKTIEPRSSYISNIFGSKISRNISSEQSVKCRNENTEKRALEITVGHRNGSSEKTFEPRKSNSSSFESKSKDRASEKSLESKNSSKNKNRALELTEKHRNSPSEKTTERKYNCRYFGSKSKSNASEESVDRRNDRDKRKKRTTDNDKSPNSKKNKSTSSASSKDKKIKNKEVYSTTEEILAEMKEIEEYQKDIENLENLLNTKLPTYVDSPVKKFTGPLLDCKALPLEEITEYFDVNIQYLTDIVSGKRYSKKHKMFYSSSSDQLIADSSVLMVYTYEQINHMASLMSKHFDSNDSKTIYFFKVLIPIFGLKIFAKEHKMTQRETNEYLNNRPFDDNN